MAQTADPKAYYGYLFESDKKPTKVLEQLLRGIANYITDFVGNKDDKSLTPAKLASFYKAVGGNYDSLFVDVPYPSISWIYASIGCQHTLQPTSDDFSPPSVPALTTRGFVRWQSIEILLGPEEHVPFIQNAVRNFAIKNPDNGESFPTELPTEAFPLKPDSEVEKWHSNCAEKLRQRATPNEDYDSSRPDLPPRPKVQAGYTHVRPPTRPRADATDYFEPKSRVASRPIPYQHVTSAGVPVRPRLSHSPSHRARQFLAPEMPPSGHVSRGRRRSFPENISSPSSPNSGPAPPDPVKPAHERRHSHPRQMRRGSVSSDASSSDEGNGGGDLPTPTSMKHGPGGRVPRPRSYHHHQARDDAPSIRYAAPPPTPPAPPAPPVGAGGAGAAPPPPSPGVRTRRRVSRERAAEKEERRRSAPIPVDLTGKLSAPFLFANNSNNRDREKVLSQQSRGPNNVRWKDLSDVNEMWRRGSKSSEEDRERESEPALNKRSSREERERDRERDPALRKRSSREERERERDRDRDRDPALSKRNSHEERDRDRDRDRDSGSSGSRKRRDMELPEVPVKPLLREDRYSSQEDTARRHHRDYDHDYDRDREPYLYDREQQRERGTTGRSFRERDRERERDRRGASPVRGVDGRKYPSVR